LELSARKISQQVGLCAPFYNPFRDLLTHRFHDLQAIQLFSLTSFLDFQRSINHIPK
jgi:hypothetical protein